MTLQNNIHIKQNLIITSNALEFECEEIISLLEAMQEFFSSKIIGENNDK